MAITFADGVILGADSRTTTGAYIANRVTDKLTRVSDTIWCCRSGSAADTQAVADIVSYYLGMYATMEGEQPSVGVAAGLFQEVCYSNKEQLSYVGPRATHVCSAQRGVRLMIVINLQSGDHNSRSPPLSWRLCVQYPSWWLAPPTVLRHRRLRINVHLRLLRFILEGKHVRS